MSIFKKKYNILEYPHKLLLRESGEVKIFDKNLKHLANTMHKICDFKDALGLAAVQIGVPKRVIITSYPYLHKTFINPVILHSSKETSILPEGCLSYPNNAVLVERPDTTTIRYKTIDNKEFTTSFTGVLGRILQHEIDHLNGINIKDIIINQ